MLYDGHAPKDMTPEQLDAAEAYVVGAIEKAQSHLAMLYAGYMELCEEQSRRLRTIN